MNPIESQKSNASTSLPKLTQNRNTARISRIRIHLHCVFNWN